MTIQVLGNNLLQVQEFFQAILEINDKNAIFEIGFTGKSYYFKTDDQRLLAMANMWWNNNFA